MLTINICYTGFILLMSIAQSKRKLIAATALFIAVGSLTGAIATGGAVTVSYAQTEGQDGGGGANTGGGAGQQGGQQGRIVQQGTATSQMDPLPGHEGHQYVEILPLMQDGSIYSGVLTYTASEPVEVVIPNVQTLNATEQSLLNATEGEFGALLTSQLDNQTSIAISIITPEYGETPVPSASIPFAGNAVWLHTIDGTPFTATFAVNALVLPSQIQNKFNDPLETADTEALEDDEEGADGETTEEDVDNENTTDTDTDGASEQGDDLDAEEETEEDATATTTNGD